MTDQRTVLLIDDDPATNFLHQMVVEEWGRASDVVTVESGAEALSYLSSKTGGAYPTPDLIFLDINMPGMNGWEFLGHYQKLPEEQQGGRVVMMLTTSMNPDDRARSAEFGLVAGFFNKPLTVEMLETL